MRKFLEKNERKKGQSCSTGDKKNTAHREKSNIELAKSVEKRIKENANQTTRQIQTNAKKVMEYFLSDKCKN